MKRAITAITTPLSGIRHLSLPQSYCHMNSSFVAPCRQKGVLSQNMRDCHTFAEYKEIVAQLETRRRLGLL